MSVSGLADMQTALTNVRFEGYNGHDADVTRCLLMTQSGHSRRKTQWVRVRNGDQTITPRIAFAT